MEALGGMAALDRMPRHSINLWIENELRAIEEHPTQRAPTEAQAWRMQNMGVTPATAHSNENVGVCFSMVVLFLINCSTQMHLQHLTMTSAYDFLVPTLRYSYQFDISCGPVALALQAKAVISAGYSAEDIPRLLSMPPTLEQLSRIRHYGHNGQLPSSYLEAEGTLVRLEYNRGLAEQFWAEYLAELGDDIGDWEERMIVAELDWEQEQVTLAEREWEEEQILIAGLGGDADDGEWE
jgi:hypothetical protein